MMPRPASHLTSRPAPAARLHPSRLHRLAQQRVDPRLPAASPAARRKL